MVTLFRRSAVDLDMASPSEKSIAIMAEVYGRFWPTSPGHVIRAETLRHAAQLDLLKERVPAGGAIVDLGCGWGAFAAGCAAAGYRVTMIDDRGDLGFYDPNDRRQGIPKAYGITSIESDVVEQIWSFADASLDAVTSFDSMEHWHNSPKKLFQSIVRSLKPGAWLILGVPNAANLKKRIEAVLGLTEWSAMDEWYDNERFRGHVREPTVRDLRHIGNSLGLTDIEILGFNWLGHGNASGLVSKVTPIIDHVLRLRPSLCSDIYLLAKRPRDGAPSNGGRGTDNSRTRV